MKKEKRAHDESHDHVKEKVCNNHSSAKYAHAIMLVYPLLINSSIIVLVSCTSGLHPCILYTILYVYAASWVMHGVFHLYIHT